MNLNITHKIITFIDHSENQVSIEHKTPKSMIEFSENLCALTEKYFGEFKYTFPGKIPKIKNKTSETYSCFKSSDAFLEITETIKTKPSNGLVLFFNMFSDGSDNEEITTYIHKIKVHILHPESYSDTRKYNFKAELNKLINMQQKKEDTSTIKTNFNPHLCYVIET
jgi:hypothetical protein